MGAEKLQPPPEPEASASIASPGHAQLGRGPAEQVSPEHERSGHGSPQAAPALASPPRPRWSTSRVAAVEALWGEGYVSPGGAAEAVRLAKPLGLSSAGSLLLLGGGLGGPAYAIASMFGAWVSNLEAEIVLADLAAHRPRVADETASKVTHAPYDRASPVFPLRSASHALALEALRGTPPAPFIAGVAAALRPHGQFVMTELVKEGPLPASDREFAAWCRLENRLPELPQASEVDGLFQEHQFDVRVTEDISDRHVTQTLAGWRDAVRGLASGPKPAAGQAAAFVTEAELWLLRIRLMRRLGLRLMRWHCIALA